MRDKGENIWSEVGADLKEKTDSGYKMALLDSDKLLCSLLDEKGYPGKDLKKKLFWAGINLSSRPDLKNAIKKKEEILKSSDYRLSSFEIEDYLAAYKKAIEKVADSDKLDPKKRIGLYLEGTVHLSNMGKSKVLISILIIFLGIKALSSTETGQKIVSKVVEVDDFLFDWFVVVLLVGLGIATFVFISFIFLDKKKKVRIKE